MKRINCCTINKKVYKYKKNVAERISWFIDVSNVLGYCSNVHEDNSEIIDLIVLLKFLLKFNKCIIYVVCLFVK